MVFMQVNIPVPWMLYGKCHINGVMCFFGGFNGFNDKESFVCVFSKGVTEEVVRTHPSSHPFFFGSKQLKLGY